MNRLTHDKKPGSPSLADQQQAGVLSEEDLEKVLGGGGGGWYPSRSPYRRHGIRSSSREHHPCPDDCTHHGFGNVPATAFAPALLSFLLGDGLI